MNRSEVELILDLKASDPGNLCSYALTPARLNLPVGEPRQVGLKVLPFVPLEGQASRRIQFEVTARIAGETMPVSRLEGEWEQWLPPSASAAPVKPAAAPAVPEKQAASPAPSAQTIQPEIPLPTPR